MIQAFYSKLSDTEKKVFNIAAIILLVTLVDRLFWGPVFSRLKSLDEAIVREEGHVKRDLRLLVYKDRILNENQVFSRFYLKEPKTEEEIIAGFLKKIEMMATQANVNLVRVTPSEAKQQKNYQAYLANLECSGTLNQIVSFIHLIDTSDELLKVERMSMGPKRGSVEEISATMTVSKMIIKAEEPADSPVKRSQ